ncbi:MAG: NAD(P)-dependent oxidoreductase [Planctomycetes bacterium]|nr:NAD(P)-dependent oxidoreductase [Planctomycetota bacterium]
MNVLVVGAAGYVASIVIPGLEKEHTCKFFDHRPVPGREAQTIVADVTDEAAITSAVRGIDAILYLAMGATDVTQMGTSGPRKDIKAIGPAFAVNTAGWFGFILHGLAAGVKKFVYASTISVWSPEMRPVPFDETLPPDAFHAYGVSKQTGELTMRAGAQHSPHSTFVSLRLFAPRNEADYAKARDAGELKTTPFLAPNDTRRLFLAALACDHPGFHIIMASGDAEGRHYIQRRALDLLGWSPKGD